MRKVYFLAVSGKKLQILKIFNSLMYLCNKSIEFKKYQPCEKFIFQQLIVNFANFHRNINMLMKKKKMHLKNIIHEKILNFNSYLQVSMIFGEITVSVQNKIVHLKNIIPKKVHNLAMSFKFCQFSVK